MKYVGAVFVCLSFAFLPTVSLAQEYSYEAESWERPDILAEEVESWEQYDEIWEIDEDCAREGSSLPSVEQAKSWERSDIKWRKAKSWERPDRVVCVGN